MNINEMFGKIQMTLMMKTRISNKRLSRLNSRKIQISFDRSMVYYLVTLLAKYTSFFFQAMSKLFLK